MHQGVAKNVQGQVDTQVHQKEGGRYAHLRQEKAEGAKQRAGSHEEVRGQKGLMHSAPINDRSVEGKKEKEKEKRKRRRKRKERHESGQSGYVCIC